MKLFKTISLLSLLLTTSAALANNDLLAGQKLFTKHCSSCHGIEGGMDMKKRIAPPIAGVRLHYIGSYTDELSFVNAVANWVEAPDKNNSMMRGAIRRFGLMPKIKVSRADVEQIATYIFKGDLETPAGMKEHIEKMHGKRNKH